MALRLLFLGKLEDVAGAERRDVAHAGSLADVVGALEPDLQAILGKERIRMAVNGVLVADPSSIALADGDEVAFLPPVSGG